MKTKIQVSKFNFKAKSVVVLLVMFVLTFSIGVHQVNAQTDLVTTIAVDNAEPNEGDIITYTLTVVNNGPNAATVSLDDSLPAGTVYDSHIATGGTVNTYDGVTWNIGNINVPIIVRLQGTNADIAKELIDNSGLAVESAVQFQEAADKVKEVLA